MTALPPPPGLADSDFERIMAAVLETERGRWFLAEYAQRIRAESVKGMASSLERIENMLAAAQVDSVQASVRLSALVRVIEERLLDLAWRLRERREDDAVAAIEADIAALRAVASSTPPSSPGGPRMEPMAALAGGGSLTQRLTSLDRTLLRRDAENPQAPLEAAQPAPRHSTFDFKASLDERVAKAFAAIDSLSYQEKLAFFV